jgi:hypothetical protein
LVFQQLFPFFKVLFKFGDWSTLTYDVQSHVVDGGGGAVEISPAPENSGIVAL